MVLGWTQPLTEMSTRNLLGGKEGPVRNAVNVTAIWADCLENVEASMPHNATSIHGVLQG
jgi:hypothetical protein